MSDAERRQRVDDGVDHGRGRGDGAGFADALDAQRIVRAGRGRAVEFERDQVVDLGQRVVHQRARDELSALVVHRVLPQRLTDALGQPPVELAVNDHRVDHVADVVDCDIAQQLDGAGLRVDKGDADMGAERIGEVGGVVERGGGEARLQVVGVVVRQVRLERHVAEPERAVRRAGDAEAAVFVLDVLGGCFEQVGGDLLALLDDLVDASRDRRTADGGAAAAVGAHAELDQVGVAVDDLDRLRRDAEPVGDDLGEGRLVTLSVGGGAGVDGDGTGGVDAHVGALPQSGLSAQRADDRRGRETASLDVGRETDPELPAAGAVGAAGRLLAAQVVVADHLERAVHRRRVVARVVRERDLGLVREGVRRHEVSLANFDRPQTSRVAGEVHQPLDDEGRLRPSGAAVGVDRRGMGEDAGDMAVDRRDVVLAGQQSAVEIGRHGGREGREVGAHGGLGVDPQADDAAVAVERHCAVGRVVAAVGVGEVRLRARRGPLHRAVELQ